jgi:ribonucleoside-diphosphate reductase alpha chain
MPDGVTPRAWLASELRHVYFKKGDQSPCVAGCHPHCFTGTMRLHTNLGQLTFDSLVGKGDLTLVVDQRIKNRKFPANHTGKEIPGEVRLDRHSKGTKFNVAPGGVYPTGDKECVKITLKSGHFIEVSKDHEMWVDDDTDGVKVKASDIKVGDKIPLVSGESIFGKDSFPIEAELMGNLLGDGYIDPKSNWAHWCFFGNDIPYGNELLVKACSLEQGKGLAALHRSGPELVKKGPDNVYRCDRATFNSQVLGKSFVEGFSFSKLPRRVPERVWSADKLTVASFLRGLYAADGNVNADCTIVLAQNDIELLKEIQLLISCFGVTSYICKHEGPQTKKFVRQDGTVREVKFKECWRLIFGGVGNLEIFQKEIGFGVPVKNERVADRIASAAGKKRLGSWRTSLVVSVENIGVKPTYCVTEPMTNTVTVNGIVTGQCRHSLVSILPGYGFKNGVLSYIEPGYSIIDEQRK